MGDLMRTFLIIREIFFQVLAHIPPRHEGWWKCPELQKGNGIASWHCKDEICQAKCEKNSWPLHNVENDGAFTKLRCKKRLKRDGGPYWNREAPQCATCKDLPTRDFYRKGIGIEKCWIAERSNMKVCRIFCKTQTDLLFPSARNMQKIKCICRKEWGKCVWTIHDAPKMQHYAIEPSCFYCSKSENEDIECINPNSTTTSPATTTLVSHTAENRPLNHGSFYNLFNLAKNSFINNYCNETKFDNYENLDNNNRF